MIILEIFKSYWYWQYCSGRLLIIADSTIRLVEWENSPQAWITKTSILSPFPVKSQCINLLYVYQINSLGEVLDWKHLDGWKLECTEYRGYKILVLQTFIALKNYCQTFTEHVSKIPTKLVISFLLEMKVQVSFFNSKTFQIQRTTKIKSRSSQQELHPW